MDNEIPNMTEDISAPSGCPHLGIVDDASTKIGFPSSQNRCYRCKPTMCPSFVHQKFVCLQSTYKECPLQINEKLHRLENDLVWKNSSAQKRKNVIGIALEVMFVFLAAAGIVYGAQNGWSFKNVFPPKVATLNPSATETMVQPTASLTVEIIPTSTITIENTNIPTPDISPTSSSSPTITLTVTKTPYPKVTWTYTPTKTKTATPLIEFSATHTPSFTPSATLSSTATPTFTATSTSTNTPTPIDTATNTTSNTAIPTNTPEPPTPTVTEIPPTDTPT